jgi:hypothetical protein
MVEEMKFVYLFHLRTLAYKGELGFVGLFQRGLEGSDNPVQVVERIFIPEPQHPVAFGLQVLAAFLVVLFLFKMLAAIEFDDEFLFDATKISYKRPNRVLPAEVDAQLVIAQGGPQFLLGEGCIVAQFASAVHNFRVASR